MDSTERISKFWTDDKKKQVLEEVKSTLDPSLLTDDLILAQKVNKLSINVGRLAQSAQTTSDISFTVNLVDYTADCVATHLECHDPNRELFHELTIADGSSLSSWCPGMYSELEELTKSCFPARLSFQKFITFQDIVQRENDPKEANLKERKKRGPRQLLSQAPTVMPQKITVAENIQSHKVNMEAALNILSQCTEVPVSFFKFVINPNSFVQTVYNLFIVSFLVHEQHALLSISENHELMIQCSPELTDSQTKQLESNPTIQLVHSISPSEWCGLVKHLNISTSMLPDFCPKNSQYFLNNQLSRDLEAGVTFLNP